MKKILLILIILLIGFTFLGGLFFFLLKGKTNENKTPAVSSENEKVVPIEERPFVLLTPRADGHEIKMEIKNIKNADKVEYELSYMAGEFSRGTLGEVELDGTTSINRDLLLGSESCSGGEKKTCRYKYDEGVDGGTLVVRLRKNKEVQKYETPFSLKKGDASNQLTLSDLNFSFLGNLQKDTFYLVYSPLGIPKKPFGEIISYPVAVTASLSKSHKGTLSLNLNKEASGVQVLGWSGSNWEKYEKNLLQNGKKVTVDTGLLTTFIAVLP